MNKLFKIRLCIIILLYERFDKILSKDIRKKATMVVKTIAKACCSLTVIYLYKRCSRSRELKKTKQTSNDRILQNLSSANFSGFFSS